MVYSLEKVEALLRSFSVKEAAEHVSTYDRVAMDAKAEGFADVEAMLCTFAAQEKEIAETARKVAA
jgi:rubrerythrin